MSFIRKCISPDPGAATAERERWMGGRPTFILASIGSAIGLGNFWRFPALTFKYGGAGFFIPYLMALFFFGIPIALKEVTLGQMFQRGDIGVFRGMHKRLAGIGLASVVSAATIVFYYNVVIAWSIVYFVQSFKSPLPWDESEAALPNKRGRCGYYVSKDYYMTDVLHQHDANCREWDVGQPTHIVGDMYAACIFVWIFVFACVFKGVKSSSYVVYFTVPVPTILIVILMIRGLTLDGAKEGVDMYLKGKNSNYTVSEALDLPEIWISATSQIFFSIGVCMGIMTSFGSYNKVDKPIIMDALIICFTNSFVSFMSGFAVFSVVGYLRHIGSDETGQGGGTGLAFIAFPAAITKLGVPNFWAILLFITLFTLGVDSAFSMVEAASTVIYDTGIGKRVNRMVIALSICVLGCICSIIFSSNFGSYALDIVDFYLTAYLMVLLGILQCSSVGWVFQVDQKIKEKPHLKLPILILTAGYWVSLVVWGILAFWAFYDFNWVGGLMWFICLLVSAGVSFHMSKLSFKEYSEEVLFLGVGALARSMTRLSYKDDKEKRAAWMPFFEVWWSLSVKFIIPAGLTWMLLMSIKFRAEEGHELVDPLWNYIGMIFPIAGFILFIVPVFWPMGTQQDMDDIHEALEKAIGLGGNAATGSAGADPSKGEAFAADTNKVGPSEGA
jgi:NSS family neurotransmitter:Na+ symporter